MSKPARVLVTLRELYAANLMERWDYETFCHDEGPTIKLYLWTPTAYRPMIHTVWSRADGQFEVYFRNMTEYRVIRGVDRVIEVDAAILKNYLMGVST